MNTEWSAFEQHIYSGQLLAPRSLPGESGESVNFILIIKNLFEAISRYSDDIKS